MWKLKCVLSPFLYATWAALSSSTCLILNKTSPHLNFSFTLQKRKNNNSKNNNNYKKSAFRCRYIFQMSPQLVNTKLLTLYI